nr:MAG TPA: hypothetical protein [Caudoviricetes sp.]
MKLLVDDYVERHLPLRQKPPSPPKPPKKD